MREAGQRARAVLLALPAFALLSTCGGGLDARRETLCRRAVPALVPAGASATLLRVGRGATSDSVRVDYRLSGGQGAGTAAGRDAAKDATKARWLVCGFGPGTSLESVATESGPLSGASVYLLRHYYLDTPEAAEADPEKARKP